MGNASSAAALKLKRGAMLRSLLSLALAIALGAIDAVAQTQDPVEHAKMEAFVDGAVREAMGAEKIAGVSVAVVDRAGVVLARGYGPPHSRLIKRPTRTRSSASARSRKRQCGWQSCSSSRRAS